MPISNKPVIEYIPAFLEYCKKKKSLSPSSVTSYRNFLKPFIEFLEENHKDLLPYQLNKRVVQAYKSCISNRSCSPKKDEKSIKNSTQNSYLIVLRSLILFLRRNNISVPITPNEVDLLKEERADSVRIVLNSSQIKLLKSAPDISKPSGLRDRTIIELLCSTGLRVSQIRDLTKKQIKFATKEIQINNGLNSVFISKTGAHWLKKYLETRTDNYKPLFINYRNNRNASKKLTTRSIEKLIKKYVSENNLPPVTPETLRNTSLLDLYRRNIKVHSPIKHSVALIKSYKPSCLSVPGQQKGVEKISKSWFAIEKIITKETSWLKEKIAIMPQSYRQDHLPNFCDECLLRKIAILIVSGKIGAVEYRSKDKTDLWESRADTLSINKQHGKNWHKKMMARVAHHLKKQNYNIVLEPTSNYGRADLGAHAASSSKKSIIIEVGTVSPFKLWHNLSTSRDLIYLIIPHEDYILEFGT